MGNSTVTLKSPKVDLKAVHNVSGFTSMTYGSMFLMMTPKGKGSFSIDTVDLTDVAGVELGFAFDKPTQFGYSFEIRLDGLDGKKVGEATLAPGTEGVKGAGGFNAAQLNINMEPVTDGKMHNVYLISNAANAGETGTLVLRSLQFKAK